MMAYEPAAAVYTLGPATIALGDGTMTTARLTIAQGRITGLLDPDGPSDFVLPEGSIIAPGLIDLHTNGAQEKLFNRDQSAAVATASRTYAAAGTTGFVATIMTAPWESMLHAASEVAEAAFALEEEQQIEGARCLGLHFEGPFLNPRARGIHRPDWLLPASAERVQAMIEASRGALVMVTMAPEVEGVADAARLLSAKGIVCSAGHTTARYQDGRQALALGFRTVTHSFNAMPPLDHRDPSVLLAFALDARAMPQVICDGFHVAPPMIEMLARLVGDRLVLSTDNMPPAGAGYHLKDGVMRAEDGTIAGSALNPAQALRNLMHFARMPFERAIVNVTSAPAKLLGQEQELGRIERGLRADLSIWSDDRTVIATIVGGVPVYGSAMLRPTTAPA